jgi:hypothetical protein
MTALLTLHISRRRWWVAYFEGVGGLIILKALVV